VASDRNSKIVEQEATEITELAINLALFPQLPPVQVPGNRIASRHYAVRIAVSGIGGNDCIDVTFGIASQIPA
jgi:hypothetical protein